MRKVLVIEDNRDNFEVIEGYLEECYELYHAPDGEAGLEKVEEVSPDLVLLDISLPKMDGERVLVEIRSRPAYRSLPVVALTAHAMRGDKERFLELGFDAYVGKPILDPRHLVELLDRLMERG